MYFQTKMRQFASVVIILRMLKNVAHEKKHTGGTVSAIKFSFLQYVAIMHY